MNKLHPKYLLLLAVLFVSPLLKAQQTIPAYDANGNVNGTLVIDNFTPLANYDRDEYNGVMQGISPGADKSIKAIPTPAPAYPWGGWPGWAYARKDDALAIFLPNNNEQEYNPHHPMNAYLESQDTIPGQVRCADFSENARLYAAQTTDGKEKFQFSFTVQNNSPSDQIFYYKIYYQNESYKWPDSDARNYKNFYGSFGFDENRFQSLVGSGPLAGTLITKGVGQGHWGVVQELVPANGKITVIDYFRIRGNPRNELMCYTGPRLEAGLNAEFMDDFQNLEYIESNGSVVYDNTNDTWPNSAETLVQMLVDDGLDLDFRIYKNATTNEFRECGDFNLGRENRNPQVGDYSFMLMATSDINEVPGHIVDISKKELLSSGKKVFVNPFAYFHSGAGTGLSSTAIIDASNTLKMYIEPLLSSKQKYDNNLLVNDVATNRGQVLYSDGPSQTSNISPCSEFMAYPYADHFEGWPDYDEKVKRFVPFLADIIGDNWTQMDYTWHRNFVQRSIIRGANELIPAIDDYRHVDGATPVPGPGNGELHLTIPGHTWDDITEDQLVTYTYSNGDVEDLAVRESPTVELRYPLTYGKYRAQIEFPEILSQDSVFNGITCAFWFFGGGGRRCDNDVTEFDIELYPAHPNSWFRYGPERVANADQHDHTDWSPNALYSKQDIRVDISMFDYRKRASNCDCTFPVPNPIDLYSVVIEPDTPNIYTLTSGGQNFETWRNPAQDTTGRIAIKQASRIKHDELFGKDFWYEIEWTPTAVYYRIGPTENNLQLVGYMPADRVKLPEAAETLIINIEFLPNADTYATDDIPFNSAPITAKIKQVIIE